MRTCYNCDTTLSNKNKTGEHVIPNSIGGRLISYKLLCRQCNIALGETIDAELARRFDNLSAFMGIERHRKKKGNIKDVRNGNGELSPLDDGPDFDPLLLRAIAKIAINTFLHFGGERKYVDTLVHIIKEKQLNENHIHHHPSPSQGFWAGTEVVHLVHIKGCPQKRILFAYIVLFGSFGFVVNFDDNYIGGDLEYNYCFDVISGTKTRKSIRIDYGGRQVFTDYIASNLKEVSTAIAAAAQENLDRMLSLVKTAN